MRQQNQHTKLLYDLAKHGVEPSDVVVRQKYEDFKVDVTHQALKILRERIPIKILHFNEKVNIRVSPGEFLTCNDLEPLHSLFTALPPPTIQPVTESDLTTTSTPVLPLTPCLPEVSPISLSSVSTSGVTESATASPSSLPHPSTIPATAADDECDEELLMTRPFKRGRTSSRVCSRPSSTDDALNGVTQLPAQPTTAMTQRSTICHHDACLHNLESLPPVNDAKLLPVPTAPTTFQQTAPVHAQIAAMEETIRREAAELIEMVGIVKLWIQLNVPRIEDGNNFGVAIQEEAIQELGRVEEAAFSLCDGIKYHVARAKLISKVVKYPNIEDYTRSVIEVDRKEWLHLKVSLIDMRNSYSSLYDLLHKNWEKVVRPRSADGNFMVM